MSLVIGSNNMASDPLRRQGAVQGNANQNGNAAEVRINIKVDPPLPLTRTTATSTSSASAAVARDIGNAVLLSPELGALQVDAAGKGVSVLGGQTVTPARDVDQAEAVDRPPVLGPQPRSNCCQSELCRVVVRWSGALVALGGAVVTILAMTRPDLQDGVPTEEQFLGGAGMMVAGLLACLWD